MIYRLEIRQLTLAKLARLENCKEIFFLMWRLLIALILGGLTGIFLFDLIAPGLSTN